MSTTIKSLEGHRWFIWTLVFLVVAGVALTAYISFSGVDTIAAWPTHVTHRSSVSVQNQQSNSVQSPVTKSPAK